MLLRIARAIPFLFAAVIIAPLHADPALANVYARAAQNLDGKWHVIVDPYEMGYYDYRRQPLDQAEKPTSGYFLDQSAKDKTELVEYNFDQSPTLMVPGDWNSQAERLLLYEGSVWYRRKFDYHRSGPSVRAFLYFGAVNYRADVYLNGKKLGTHIGGFTPFSYEVTGLVKETGNSLVVRVDNTRHLEAVPTINTDWWNYGGLTRDVLLAETPATFISAFHLQLKKGTTDRLEASVQLDGERKQQKVHVAIAGSDIAADLTTDSSGAAHAEIAAPGLALWSPEQPKLFGVTFEAETDRTTDRIGFRSIEVRGSDILLNGKPLFLRGVCIHEENPLRKGRAYSVNDARLLLGWAKELNCNFVRLAHYPHNEFMARTADELGLLVWEEVPVYWTIQWDNPDTLQNARTQLTDLITRDHNRASVIVWSVANETPVSPSRTRFLKTLVETARSLDNTRLVSAAMEVRKDIADPNLKVVDDPFGEFTDLLSFNEYVGWYDGLPDKTQQITWKTPYTKPIVISEFGADALQGMHGDTQTRFSEEYQAEVYRQTIAMLQKIPQWRGTTPWILCDFRSPRRVLPNIQDGWNRKGLIGENGVKKQAFSVLQEFYAKKAAEK
jgi:beta-glucuronidase